MFRVSLELEDDELDAYRAIGERIGASTLTQGGYGGLLVMGSLASLACAALLFGTGAVSRGAGGAIAALVFGAYWLGAWAPSIWARLVGSRRLSNDRDQLRRALRGAVLIVGARRLAMVGEGWRTVLERGAVHAVTQEGDLTLIWRAPDIDIYPFAVVPTRRLTSAQQAEFAAFPAPRASGENP